MDCLNPNCQNEVTGDYPMCATCATTRHFTNRNDCQCGACVIERADLPLSECEIRSFIAWEKVAA